jgi:hypothetical protein
LRLIRDGGDLLDKRNDAGRTATAVGGDDGEAVRNAGRRLGSDKNPGALCPHLGFSLRLRKKQHRIAAVGGCLGRGFGILRLALDFAQRGEGEHDADVGHDGQKQARRPGDAILQGPRRGRRRGRGNGDMRQLGIARGAFAVGW